MKTSVIVCAYTEDRWMELGTAITSLQNQSHQADEIVIVIDHNPILLKRTQRVWPDLTVIPNHLAQGLSGARNSGISVTSGDIILFIDEDAYAAANWIETLLEAYADPAVIGAGGSIIPQWHKSRPNWFPGEFNWVVGCTYTGLPETPQPVRNLIGCNMSFRREAFETVGLFRDGIGRIGTVPLGCEETELCIRITQELPQNKLIHLPDAQVFHFVPEQRHSLQYFRKRCFAEGISKAAISYFIGHQDAITTEQIYVRKVLPQGVAKGIFAFIKQSESGGLGKAASIIFGFLTTLSGYVWGNLSHIYNRKTNSPMMRKQA
ncbi:MAG: glycosyltransferase family 2 protein [Anaerolineae bacterium]